MNITLTPDIEQVLNDLAKKHPQKLKELVGNWEKYKEENGVLD